MWTSGAWLYAGVLRTSPNSTQPCWQAHAQPDGHQQQQHLYSSSTASEDEEGPRGQHGAGVHFSSCGQGALGHRVTPSPAIPQPHVIQQGASRAHAPADDLVPCLYQLPW